MRVSIDRFSLKDTLTKMDYLFAGHVFFMGLAVLGQWFVEERELFETFVLSLILFVLYQSMNKVLKNLQYTFWSFAVIMAAIASFYMLESDHGFVINCYFAALIFLGILSLVISSPILYPRVMWWEYDFRFRGDLKIWAHLEDRCVEGRLTDLRGEAGCIVLFEKLKSGQDFKIDYVHNGERMSYCVKAMTRRESTLGRGYTYGVKFTYDQDGEKDRYKNFALLWKVKKRAKRELKFQSANV